MDCCHMLRAVQDCSGQPGTMWLSKQEYGQVPQYLLKRKLAMAAAYAQELVTMGRCRKHACIWLPE